MSDGGRARAELRAAPFAPLWRAARRAAERHEASFTLTALAAEEARAVHGLLGRSSARITLAELDAAVQAALGVPLAAWLVELGGPLRDRDAERSARSARREATEALAVNHPLAAAPWFDDWLDGLSADGTLATAARLEERGYLQGALDVLAAVLPGTFDGTSLAAVVAGATGDTKRLTSATVRAMVERALALAAGVPRPVTSQDRRLLWRRFGVVVDDVSSDVLVLGVRVAGTGRLAGWLDQAADVGEPFRVTLRQLSTAAVRVDAPVVWVCENPAVVMDVATHLGPGAGSLVCTEGVPTDAFWSLLGRVAGGTEVRVRADFDAAGCAIVGSVVDRAGGRPWRFDTATYRAALAQYGTAMALPRSKGVVPATPWDPRLSAAIAADGRAVYEELLLDLVLADLVLP